MLKRATVVGLGVVALAVLAAFLPGLLDAGAPEPARPAITPPAGEIAVLALGLLLLFAVGFAVSLWLQRRRQRRQARANR